jgi:hypothetical protein
VIVDVRGLGNFQRDMSNSIFAEGQPGTPLWPDPEKVRGVSSALVNELGLSESYTTDAAIQARLRDLGVPAADVTRVKASRVQASRFAPQSGVLVDATLNAAAARAFLAAGDACRVIFLKN